MSNKSLGNAFEQELCQELAKAGFWAHNMANRSNGQPADVVAGKDGIIYLIDAKVCSNGIFNMPRIETNQHLAMQQFARCGNWNAYIAFKLGDEIYFHLYQKLKSSGKRTLNAEYIATGKRVEQI